MPAFTINTKTGMFVQGGGPRRSPRLARTGTVRVVPRVTVVPEVPEVPEVPVPVVPVPEVPVPEVPVPVVPPPVPAPPTRRTSPRLVAYYAARDARVARTQQNFQLIKDVLEFAAKKTPLQQATANLQALIDKATASRKAEDITAVMEFFLKEALMPEIIATRPHLVSTTVAKAKELIEHTGTTDALRAACCAILDRYAPGSYKIFYDPRVDKEVVCSCGKCHEQLMEVIVAEATEFIKLFDMVDRTSISSPERLDAILRVTVRLLDSPNAAILVKVRPVLTATVKEKTVEWMNDPKSSHSLRILCRAVLDKYFF